MRLKFQSDIMNHIYGMIMFALFAIIYSVQHFFNSFFFKSNALLYDLTIEMILCVFISMFIVITIWSKKIKPFTQLIWAGLCLMLGGLYLLLIPTVLDRSLSIYMLSKLETNVKVDKYNWEKDIEKEYFTDYKVFDTRLVEQKVSGSIIVDKNGLIEITNRGEKIVELTEFYRDLLADKYQK